MQFFHSNLCIFQNVLIRQSHDPDSKRFQISPARLVSLGRPLHAVYVAVQFDDQARLGTVEVDDKGADAVLSAELVPAESFGS
jgi:hypothetical protein